MEWFVWTAWTGTTSLVGSGGVTLWVVTCSERKLNAGDSALNCREDRDLDVEIPVNLGSWFVEADTPQRGKRGRSFTHTATEANFTSID